jgi:phosphoglycolate phosphatase
MFPRLVVFDLDGTLVDSRRDIAHSANELVELHGGRPLPEAAIVRMVGEGARRLIERAFDASGLGAPNDHHVEEFVGIYARRLIETTELYEGVAPLLDGLAARAALALITNKPTVLSCRLLEHFGLAHYFSTVTGGDSPYPRKPAPDSLRAAMHAARAEQDETVMVGDSHIDLGTARAAGVRFCLAGYGFGVEQMPEGLLSPDDLVARRPLELPDLLAGPVPVPPAASH